MNSKSVLVSTLEDRNKKGRGNRFSLKTSREKLMKLRQKRDNCNTM